MSARLLVGVVLLVLLAGIRGPPLTRASTTTIDLTSEYSSGDVSLYSDLQAWYASVNINGTHTIFIALHSNELPSPVSAFVGQGYTTSTGSNVFVGNAIVAMEVYNDTDGNGYLDANYTAGTTELRYTITMNASQTFTPTPVHKTILSNVPHYAWNITYGGIQAILAKTATGVVGSPYGGGLTASYLQIDHVTMSYDYSISGNSTYLKTGYDIGNVTLVPPRDPGVTLKGLSLSLLETALTVSSQRLSITAGGSSYDSQLNTAPSSVNTAQLIVNNGLTYEFRFKDNYTLQTNPPVTHPVVYVASPDSSLPSGALQGSYLSQLIRVNEVIKAQLPAIAGLPSTTDLNYSTSRFLYRISYPVWSGFGVKHDPIYVAHFVPIAIPSSHPPSIPPILLIGIAAASAVMVFAVYRRTRRRKSGVQPIPKLTAP